MKKIFIEILNKLITIDDNFINTVSFIDSENYKLFSFNILRHISYSIDNEIVDTEKYGMVIYNPFQISFSDKKFISALYKKIEKELNDEEKQIINQLEKESFQLFDLFNLNSNYKLEYSEQVDFQKYLSAFNLTFSNDIQAEYLEGICQYFKICCDFLNIKIVISFGLLNLLNSKEIELLNKELQQLDLVLLDIQYVNQTNTKTLLVDKDWCII